MWQWTIVDMENAATHSGEPAIGEQCLVIASFRDETAAVAWLDAYPDQEKVYRGGFGLDQNGDE